jgi:photosynthetic reaction center cytochrome c subunit
MKRLRWLVAGTVIVVGTAFAQQAPSNGDKPVEETKKNIKVFKGMPTSQLIPVMAFMSNSLGVTCAHCHTKEWESDEKEEKDVARGMINMVKDINDRHFAGDDQAVTCNTCHNGHVRPNGLPSLADAGWNKKPAPTAATATLPSIDDVLARYLTAVGGAKAIAGVKTIVEAGTVLRESGRTDPESKPVRVTLGPGKASVDTELSYPPEANQEISSWLGRLAHLNEAKSQLRVAGIVPVRGRDAYAVEVKASQGRPDWLYFDVKDGLLLRRRHELRTPLGVLPAEYDYDDYRLVDTLKVPFKMTWSRADYKVTHTFDDVKVQ